MGWQFFDVYILTFPLMCRKEGQQTQEEVQKRNLRDELEERERKHFSSKDKSYVGNTSGPGPSALSSSFVQIVLRHILSSVMFVFRCCLVPVNCD